MCMGAAGAGGARALRGVRVRGYLLGAVAVVLRAAGEECGRDEDARTATGKSRAGAFHCVTLD
jgi:hypothetical protein